MDNSSPLLQDLTNKYGIVYVNSKNEEDIFRSTISCKEEAECFVKEFGRITKSEWIIKYELKNPNRLIFHKAWVCQHSKKNKKSDNYRNANCSAYLNIYVKKTTRDTRQKDEYLRKDPPLPAIIKLQPQHSHNIDTPDTLRMRRVLDETKAKFVKYFEAGLTASQSSFLHAQIIKGYENSEEILVDSAVNPTFRQVIYLYNSWKQGTLRISGDGGKEKDEALKFQELEKMTGLESDFSENLSEVIENINSQESDTSSDESQCITESISDEVLKFQEQEEMADLEHDFSENLPEVMKNISSQESDRSSGESEHITESISIPKVPNVYSISVEPPFLQRLQEAIQESSMSSSTLSSSISNNIEHVVQTSQASLSDNMLKTRLPDAYQQSNRFISSRRNASRCVAKKRISLQSRSTFKAKREPTPIKLLQRNNSLLQKITGTVERIEKSLNVFYQSSHLMHDENEQLENIARWMERSARTFEEISSSVKEIGETG